MRDIEFKAWDGQKMYYQVESINFNHKTIESRTVLIEGLPLFLKVSNGVIFPQYTEFKDVNGIKAFDKDLVEYEMFYEGDSKEEGGIGIIKWCDGEWIVEKQDGNFICGIWDVMTNYGGTIIGSSYERKGWRQEGGGINVKY